MKKLVSILLSLVLCLGMFPPAALAAEDPSASGPWDCGAEGSSVTATLKDGVLTISGTGRMKDYTNSDEGAAPWYSLKDSITSLVIEEGVTYIGNNAFSECSALSTVTAPCGAAGVKNYPWGAGVTVNVDPHAFDGNGTCTSCGTQAVATVKKDSTTQYAVSLDDAFAAENTSAVVTLIGDVTPEGSELTVPESTTFTLDLAGHTIAATQDAALAVKGTLTIQDSSTGKTGAVTSDRIALAVQGTLKLEGGTFTGTTNAIQMVPNHSQSVTDLLGTGCAYYRDDSPIPLASLDGKKDLPGPVKVGPCTTHNYTYTHLTDTTHSKTCSACNKVESENCQFANGTCPLCGNSDPSTQSKGYTLNYANETITVEDGYEVRATSDDTSQNISSGNSISMYLGKTLYVRKAAVGESAASEWTSFTLAARPARPTNLTGQNETIKGKKDGYITGTDNTMEYSVNVGAWTACTGNKIENLAGESIVRVQVKATESAPCGDATTVRIYGGTPITVRFETNPGTQEIRDNLSYGALLTKPADPVRENYQFLGWYNGETAWDFDTDTLTETITLTAKWKPINFTVGGKVVQGNPEQDVSGATVKLMKGSTVVKTAVTDENGTFTFDGDIPAGAYNLVTVYNDRTNTTLITVKNGDVNETVKLPPAGVDSHLDVKAGTPPVAVGGLDEEASYIKTNTAGATSASVTMTVESKGEPQVPTAAVEAMKNELKANPSSAPSEPMAAEYLDITMEKTVDSNTTPLTETNKPIKIVWPFDFTGKEKVTFVRYHGTDAKVLDTSKPNDGSCELDEMNNTVTIYASKFSYYAAFYNVQYNLTFHANGGTLSGTVPNKTASDGTMPSVADPTRDGYTFKGWYTAASGGTQVTASTKFTQDTILYAHWEQKSSGGGGGGGGGWYPSSYRVIVEDAAHGKVKASSTWAYAGSTVTLTAVPHEGFRLSALTVTDSRGEEVKLTQKDSVKYVFTMPSRDVTVRAAFTEIPQPTSSPSPSPEPWKNPFPDVDESEWYMEAIQYVCETGLMHGHSSGKFGPDDPITRAQFAQILYNMEGRPQAGSGVFSDVTTDWYADAVNWAAAEGVVTGIGGGKFAPNRPIARQDLAVMLWRYAGSPEPRKHELDFTDAGTVSTYAWKALCWANENGIVDGKGNGILDPRGRATRAEAAKMLMSYGKNKAAE